MSGGDVIAMAEDELLVWVTRPCTRAKARREASNMAGEPCDRLSDWRVTASYMRPASCPVHPQGRSDDEDITEDSFDCQCGYVEEGWHFECDRSHPEAIAVWRVEYDPPPSPSPVSPPGESRTPCADGPCTLTAPGCAGPSLQETEQ